jgi:hypothetical protein
MMTIPLESLVRDLESLVRDHGVEAVRAAKDHGAEAVRAAKDLADGVEVARVESLEEVDGHEHGMAMATSITLIKHCVSHHC